MATLGKLLTNGTSIGVEFETQMCIFDDKNILNDLVKIHLLCDENVNCDDIESECKQGWSVSLESDKVLPSCLKILEGQIGVAYSDKDTKFNKLELKKQIDSFVCFFKYITSLGKININKFDYDIVFWYNNFSCDDGIETVTKKSKNIKDIEILSLLGEPQITFGIDLKYISLLFNFISEKYDKVGGDVFYRYKFFGESINLANSFIQEIIFDKNSNEMYTEDNLNENGKKFTKLSKEKKDMIFGYLLLLFYINYIIDDEVKRGQLSTGYLKSKFVLKLRSNLINIRDSLLKDTNVKECNILNNTEIDHYILLIKKYISFSTEIMEWSYPFENSLNIFFEIRGITSFILLLNPSFYKENLKKIILNLTPEISLKLDDIQNIKIEKQNSLKTQLLENFLKLVDKDKNKKLVYFFGIHIDNLNIYCDAVIDILEKILYKYYLERDQQLEERKIGLVHPDMPFWSFSNKQKKDKLKNKNK